MQVHTTKGLVEREKLVARDIVEEHDNARVVATEWYMGDEMVRRDVHVSVLRGLTLGSQQESI